MENIHSPANPIKGHFTDYELGGITKREYAAIHIMKGLVSGGTRYQSSIDMAHDAVLLADALFAELDKAT